MTDAAQFFLDRYRAEMPTRLHSRDTNESGGPEWHRALEFWLTDGDGGPWATVHGSDLVECPHPTLGCAPHCQANHSHTRPDSRAVCPACNGSGWRERTRKQYRRPAKRALRLMRQTWVPKDRPRLDVLLKVLAANEGNYVLTAQALRSQYSFMWDRDRAASLIDFALAEFRRVYTEETITVIEGRSDAQLNAEMVLAQFKWNGRSNSGGAR